MKLSPIVLFVYNRLQHTKETVEALQKNYMASESDLIIFSDGWKNQEYRKEVEEVRNYIKTITGFKSLKIYENTENSGLARSIISGVSKIINEYGKIIVLEDDMLTSQHFLEYMNNGLNMYENDSNVISIHGYVSPTKEKLPETFFIKGADCWGWATWKRGWDIFEPDGKKLLKELKKGKLLKEFDFSNSFPYSKMLKAQINGKNNSWAIRWYASAFLKDKLTLYPGKSLIYNTGFDGSGTHCDSDDVYNKLDSIFDIKIEVSRIEIKENLSARKSIINYFKTIKKTILEKILIKIKKIFLLEKTNIDKIV
ncbi:MAG: glycosyltransferase [Candidatus Paceibacterota bacterium]